MVKRYASQKKPLYKDAPWWEKNKRKSIAVLCGITLFSIFAPMFNHIIRTPGGVIAEFNPKNHEDIRQFRKRMKSREEELADSPYGKF